MPLVSILIPVYNGEKYLEKCLKSVVSQSLEDIEIICINDGSSDSSLDIIQNFAKKDTRIKIINKENSGYAQSLNIGIKKAKGNYIGIVEADDFISLNMYEKLYEKSDGCDIVKAAFYFYPSGKKYHLNISHKQDINSYPKMLLIKPSVWSAIYKKSFLLNNNIFFNPSKGASYQDVSFQFKVFFHAQKIFFLDSPLYFYRTDNPSSSVNSKDKEEAITEEFHLINDFLKNKNASDEIISNKLLFELRAYIWNLKRIGANYNFVKKISKIFKKYDLSPFYKDKSIHQKEKIKMYIIENFAFLFYFILIVYFKYKKTKGF